MREPVAAVELPYPPSVNDYWRSRWSPKQRRVIVYLDDSGKQYRIDCLAAMLQQRGCGRRLKGRLRLTIGAYMPDRRVRDLDNIQKALLDGMKHGGLYHDDGQIDYLTIVRMPVLPPHGLIRVVAEYVEDTPLFSGQDDIEELSQWLDTIFKF